MYDIMPLNEKIRDFDKRLSKLEKKPSEENFPSRMESFKLKIEERKHQQMEKDIERVSHLYHTGLENNRISLSFANLPKIVEFSVQFVEDSFKLLAQFLNIVFQNKEDKSKFKLDMCINLIGEIFDNIDYSFLVNLIEEIVRLLFNREKYEEEKEKEKIKRKEGGGSLRRIKKIIQPF